VAGSFRFMTINSHQHILDTLRSEFADKSHWQEDMFLLSPDDAMAFIQRGMELGLRFVGVDGFSVLHTGCLQLQQAFSNAIDDRDMAYEEFIVDTMNLIQAGSSEGIVFDVVFDVIECE
jgi:hypothetical protein